MTDLLMESIRYKSALSSMAEFVEKQRCTREDQPGVWMTPEWQAARKRAAMRIWRDLRQSARALNAAGGDHVA